MLKKSFFFSILVVALFGLISCQADVGLGTALDLEAPVIKVISPANLSNVHRTFEIKGTCSDNIGVTSVCIYNEDRSKLYGTAVITEEEWSCKLSLEEQGEISLLCEANDKAGNSSNKSSQVIQLLVDDEAPEGLNWYIERENGIQTPLYTLDKIKAFDIEKSENKDVPQNQKFTICGRFFDAMSINTIVIKLSDEEGNVVIERRVSADSLEEITGSTPFSIYSPYWDFTEEELVNADPALKSGKHYLLVTYSAVDDNGNTIKDEEGNECESEAGWMLWYPESDYPHIYQSAIKDGVLTYLVSSDMPLDFFDDDGLSEIYYALKSYELINETNTIESQCMNLIESPAERSKIFNNLNAAKNEVGGTVASLTGRDRPVTVRTPEAPCDMYLVVAAKDSNDLWNSKVIHTIVTDGSTPILIVDNPANNSMPILSGGTTLKISGYGLGKKDVKSVKVAYVSGTANSSDKEIRAKKLLSGEAEPIDGEEFVKDCTFDIGNSTKDGSMIKQPFEVTCDFIEELKSSDTNYFFEFVLTDTNNISTYSRYQLVKDVSLPVITVSKPATDLMAIDYSAEGAKLDLEFKAVKTSGLGMKLDKYSVTCRGNTYTVGNGLSQSGDLIKLIVDQETLAKWAKVTPQIEFKIEAEDLLGNKGYGQRTVVLTTLPVLESITSDKSDGTYKAGDVLAFQANFSRAVRVTGTPKLVLKLNDTKDAEATYSRGSGTDVLTFSYTVKPGDASSKVTVKDPTAPIVTDESNKIRHDSAESSAVLKCEADKCLVGREIVIDGVSPYISKVEITPKNSFLNAGKTITATVTASEDLLMSGSPSLKLKIGTSDVTFGFQSLNGKTITFSYPVSSTSPNGAISFNASNCGVTSFFKDAAGNVLNIPSTVSCTPEITVDTKAPATAPTIIGVSNNATYNENPKFTLGGLESGATAYYSTNGGVSWTEYIAEVELRNGVYQIKTKQEDKAGNTSPVSEAVKVTVDADFPEFLGLSLDNTDGKYKAGSVLTFSMTFDDKVKAPAATDLILVIANTAKTVEKRLNVKPETAGSDTLEFVYTVAEGDELNGITVKSIEMTSNFKDIHGNTCDSLSSDYSRPNVVVDGKAPVISTYSPAVNGISTSTNAAGNFTVTLTFDEPVFREKGTIVMQQYGNWAIPPVLTLDQMNSIKSKLSSVADKETLVLTESGNATGTEATDYRTGIPVGPYRKITHGLKVSGGKFIPDTDTKFVLDFNLGLVSDDSLSMKCFKYKNSSTVTKTVTVSAIRSVLEKTGYHQHKMDVTSNQISVSGNTVTIKFADTIEDGRAWELIIPDTAFRDATGNYFAGLSSGNYRFSSNKVAAPVVRVDRYSHGWGAVEPNGSATSVTTITDNSQITQGSLKTNWTSGTNGCNTRPTGYARVRIDSETPGAAIYYRSVEGAVVDTATGKATKYQFQGSGDIEKQVATNVAINGYTENKNTLYYLVTNIADIASTGLTLSSGGEEYEGYFAVGDGSIYSARKDYVTAYATKTGFIQSENGYEGVFKTLVYDYNENDNSKTYRAQISIEGGTAKGGEPSVSGFPLRDAPQDYRYSKNAYFDAYNSSTNTGSSRWIWVSYEIVSDWSFLQHRKSYSTNYPSSSYGQMLALYNFSNWE